LFPLLYLLSAVFGLEQRPPGPVALCLMAAALFCAAGLWWYAGRCVVEVDELGITSRNPFATRQLLWVGVGDYGGSDPCWVVGRDGTRITFSPLISDYGRLRREIGRRAPRPVTGWTAPGDDPLRGVRRAGGEPEAIDTHEDEVRDDGGVAGGAGR
jgi:hypothetical protein